MKKDPNFRPICYTREEMNARPHELVEDIRKELARLRGKLSDIRRAYGHEDNLKHLEGGLTCIISAASHTVNDFKAHDLKWGTD